jgi:class I lanthipeptide synthase
MQIALGARSEVDPTPTGAGLRPSVAASRDSTGGRFADPTENAGDGLYRAVDAAMVRVAEMAPELADIPWLNLAGDAEQVEHWSGWLSQVWACEPFAAAVTLASPSLAAQVERILAGEQLPLRQVRRTVLSILRYRLRATSRATPFGLFAGVAPVRQGPTLTFEKGGAT